jgi:hypothetical protein
MDNERDRNGEGRKDDGEREDKDHRPPEPPIHRVNPPRPFGS